MNNSTNTVTFPLLNNEYAKELLSILHTNQLNGNELLTVVQCISSMEQHLNTATSELNSMRRELADMREQQNHPVKVKIQKAINTLKNKIDNLREKVNTLKDNFISGCKDIVAAFKENGIIALNNLSKFFHLEKAIEAVQVVAKLSIRSDENAINKVTAVSGEYHKVGRDIKNFGRVIIGRETVETTKPVGKIAKMVQAPYKLDKALCSAMVRNTDKALNSLSKLSQKAEQAKESKTERNNNKKPSVLANLRTMKEVAKTTEKPVEKQKSRNEVSL